MAIGLGTGDAGPDRNAYCEGTGPPILVGDGAGATDVCSGELAEQTFRHALCACQDFSASNDLTVDSLGATGGSVALNDKLEVNGIVDITGDLTAAGPMGVAGGATLTVGGSLASGGPLGRVGTAVTVGGDASVAGDVQLASLAVTGTLTLPDGALLDVAGATDVGAVVRAPVTVDPPCACGASDLVDIAGFVDAHRAFNHNADLGLDPDALIDFGAVPVTLDLPCGLYYLSFVQGEGPLTIRADGRVALFVGEHITLQETFRVELAPGAELDLFIGTYLNTSGDVVFGSQTAPAKVRLYVGGVGAINLSAQSSFGGNLYAPRMDLALSAGAELYGAMFVNRVTTAGPLVIHYDETVEDAGATCPVL